VADNIIYAKFEDMLQKIDSKSFTLELYLQEGEKKVECRRQNVE